MGHPAARSMQHGPSAGHAPLVATPPRLRCQPFRHNKQQHRLMTHATESSVEGSPAATVKLGGSDLEVSRLGIGTIRWGDTSKGFDPASSPEELHAAYEAARVGGVNLFDTAEVYGYQSLKAGTQAEQLLGGFVRRGASLPLDSPTPVVASKFFTIPWTNLLIGGGFRLGRKSMLDALRATLQRLGTDRLDLWQIHFPFPTWPQSTLAEGLQEAYDAGLVRAVGVCNYDAGQVEEMHGLLAKHGIPLASNQVKYSILDRGPERDGTVAKCADLGVSVIAHSPLEQGLLTARGLEGTDQKAQQARGLLLMMQFIGVMSQGGATIPQVALNWLMAKGAIPIPGARSAEQVKELVGALGWSLDDNEVAMIDEKVAALKQ